jgi:hypothetical protein
MLILVNVCAGGVTPEFPSGTGAVAKGLYLLILRVVPPFRGIAFNSAGILWIQSCYYLLRGGEAYGTSLTAFLSCSEHRIPFQGLLACYVQAVK